MSNQYKQYVKKPVVVEAIQWTGLNEKQVMEFCLGKAFFGQVSDAKHTAIRMTIETLEGVMTAQIGDFIIKGIRGEFYPYKPDIFAMTYDEFNETKFHEFANNQMPIKTTLLK